MLGMMEHLVNTFINLNITGMCHLDSTRELINPQSDHEGNKLMFPLEWRECPSVSCLAGKKKKFDDSTRLDVVEIAHVPDILPSLILSWSD